MAQNHRSEWAGTAPRFRSGNGGEHHLIGPTASTPASHRNVPQPSWAIDLAFDPNSCAFLVDKLVQLLYRVRLVNAIPFFNGETRMENSFTNSLSHPVSSIPSTRWNQSYVAMRDEYTRCGSDFGPTALFVETNDLRSRLLPQSILPLAPEE